MKSILFKFSINDLFKMNLLQLPLYLHMENTVTYISIGCACHSEWTIEEDQQFPMFLRDFKEKHKTTRINVILIDPLIGKIPYLEHIKCYHPVQNIYVCINNVIFYVFKQAVRYIPKLTSIPSDPDNLDITNLLKDLNKKCLKEDGVLIVHDFSGMEISLLDQYFSDYTISFSTKIMYDISNGQQQGCLLDLKDKVNYVNICRYGAEIILENIQKLSIDNFLSLVRSEDLMEETQKKIQLYKERLMQDFISQLHHLRRAYLWKDSIAKNKDVAICKRVIRKKQVKLLDRMYNLGLYNFYKNDKINEYISVMKMLYDSYLRDIEAVFHINIQLDWTDPNSWLHTAEREFEKFV